MTLDVSRRSLFALGAGLGLSSLGASAMLGDVAQAKAPKLGPAPQHFYRFTVGDAEVTVVSDGGLDLGNPKGTFTGVSDEEMSKMLTDNFLNPADILLEQNSPIVNMGDKLVLFDTGMGTSKMFGNTTGRQQKSMKEAGIKAEDIDAVVFSHGHIDHIGGVVGEDGKSLFPNAQFYIAESDFIYWMDYDKAGPKMKDFVDHARKNLTPVRDRLVFYKDDQEFLPGIDRAGGAGSHRRPHHLRHLIGRQIVLLHRRPHPSSGSVDGKAADAIRLRYRSDAGGGQPREDAGHAGGEQDSDPRLSLRLARHRPCRQDRRRLPLRSGGHAALRE